uniref:Putative secreted peptide n=1 Tax=Anopheles braziliensis TaxID=58242 RepID=A0A2M3ZTU1_9DIPT
MFCIFFLLFLGLAPRERYGANSSKNGEVPCQIEPAQSKGIFDNLINITKTGGYLLGESEQQVPKRTEEAAKRFRIFFSHGAALEPYSGPWDIARTR